MQVNNTSSFIFLSAIFVFSSCKKSDSGAGSGSGAPAAAAPSITSISPGSGSSATLDTITGTGFTPLDSVFFNGKGASIVNVSTTQLVVKVPPQAGTGNVSVTAGGKSVLGPVFNFTGNTYIVSTFAGCCTVSLDGAGKTASFSSPFFLAIDHNDNLYVVDQGSYKIRKVTPEGVVTTVAGNGNVGSVNGAGITASFNQPNGIAADSSGNLYVADFYNNKIRKITPAGVVSTFAGSGSPGSKNATGIAASFNGPTSVAVDGNGNVFVAENGNYQIRKITPDGVVSLFVGGSQGSLDGIGATASFVKFSGISFDAAGNLYAIDAGSSDIRKITPDGTVTTIAGITNHNGYFDGAGISALFNGPTSIVVDANGFIYVADTKNQVIRQITSKGVVTRLAGIVSSAGSDDGPALQSSFNYPTGIVMDSHGNLFVADQMTNLIRKLTAQ